jgi:hypothetical protein
VKGHLPGAESVSCGHGVPRRELLIASCGFAALTLLFTFPQVFHWHRLVNGYSGYDPPSHIELVETLVRFPQPETVRYLQRIGVRYVILHGELAPEEYPALRRELATVPELQLLMTSREADDMAVYLLREPDP